LIAENVKCWEGRHEWTFGDIVVISGSNEAGKTSMLQLVTGLFGPANERMLRPGAPEAGL
jgi:ABC-type transport system involved in cytochrome c biogenesis ATPase subunit